MIKCPWCRDVEMYKTTQMISHTQEDGTVIMLTAECFICPACKETCCTSEQMQDLLNKMNVDRNYKYVPKKEYQEELELKKEFRWSDYDD